MKQHPDTLDFTLEPTDNQRLARLCGQLDDNLRQLERRLGVEISNRGHRFRIIGNTDAVQRAQCVLQDLYRATTRGELHPEDVHLHLQESGLE